MVYEVVAPIVFCSERAQSSEGVNKPSAVDAERHDGIEPHVHSQGYLPLDKCIGISNFIFFIG